MFTQLILLQVLADVHLPLLRLVVGEAFEAAIDVAGQENTDVRWSEMHPAEPPIKVCLVAQLASSLRLLVW